MDNSPLRSTTKNSLVIGIDIDGVVTNTFYRVVERFNQRFGTVLTIEDIVTYNFLETVDVGRPGEKAAFLLELYSHDDILFNHATPAAGAVDYISRLVGGGYAIECVSARRQNLKAKTVRWLGEYGFPATELSVHLNPAPDDNGINFKLRKSQELALDLFIEDDKRVAEGLAIPTILFDHPWNREHSAPNVSRVATWTEAYQLLGLLGPQLKQRAVRQLSAT